MDPQREELLEKWLAVRNAILRAEAGELLVKYMRESDFMYLEGASEGGEAAAMAQSGVEEAKGKIVGIYVDLVLKFPGAIDRDFTPEEQAAYDKGVEDAVEEFQKENKETIEKKRKKG